MNRKGRHFLHDSLIIALQKQPISVHFVGQKAREKQPISVVLVGRKCTEASRLLGCRSLLPKGAEGTREKQPISVVLVGQNEKFG